MTFNLIQERPRRVLGSRQGRSCPVRLWGYKILRTRQHIQCTRPGIITLLGSWNAARTIKMGSGSKRNSLEFLSNVTSCLKLSGGGGA